VITRSCGGWANAPESQALPGGDEKNFTERSR
jgi:hypothetical protein